MQVPQDHQLLGIKGGRPGQAIKSRIPDIDLAAYSQSTTARRDCLQAFEPLFIDQLSRPVRAKHPLREITRTLNRLPMNVI